jgi:Bacterial Ig-like domain (group 1)/HYR domain
MRYLLAGMLVCLLGLGSAAAATAAPPPPVLPGSVLLAISSDGDQYSFDIDCQPESTSTIQFSVTGDAIAWYGGLEGSFEEQGVVTIDDTGHVISFSSTFTINANDGSVVTGTKELDTSETAGIATGVCGAEPSGSCFANTSPIDLRYTAETPARTETGTARYDGVDAYQQTCGGATDGAFWEEFLATDDPPSEPTTLTLQPESAVKVVGQPHTITATLLDQYGDPVQDYSIRFSVSGAVTGSGSCITDVLGQCGFTFEGLASPGAVTITACTDAHGDGSCEPPATATATAEYVVREPPTITTGGDLTIEATSPYGTALDYEVTATDPEDGELPVNCDPPEGGEHPLGSVQVTCTATDSDGLTATASFTVTFVDTTAPVMELRDMTAVPDGPSGTLLGWNTNPTDNADWYPTVVCEPESFEFVFPIGDTTVTCTATDDSGNSSTGSFNVHVLSVAELLRQAQASLVDYGVDPTLRRSLTAELEAAARAAERGNKAATCSALTDYQDHVRAQAGKKLSAETAEALLANADYIRRIVPCS